MLSVSALTLAAHDGAPHPPTLLIHDAASSVCLAGLLGPSCRVCKEKISLLKIALPHGRNGRGRQRVGVIPVLARSAGTWRTVREHHGKSEGVACFGL